MTTVEPMPLELPLDRDVQQQQHAQQRTTARYPFWLQNGDRSHPDLVRLDAMHPLSYPGWEMDFQATEAAHMQGQSIKGHLFRIQESERMHRNDRSHSRLQALDALCLTYPGHEDDILQAETWHLSHPSDVVSELCINNNSTMPSNLPLTASDSNLRRRTTGTTTTTTTRSSSSSPGRRRRISISAPPPTTATTTSLLQTTSRSTLSLQYRKLLQGLQNKQLLYMGDESHPNLQELLSLQSELTYPNWERDVLAAKAAHIKGAGFALRRETILEKQRVHTGDRSHWRLRMLDLTACQLSYPNLQHDVAELEQFHFHSKDTSVTELVYKRMLKGLVIKDQLFRNDRSHPTIVALDALQLTYPHWEQDYEATIRGIINGQVVPSKHLEKLQHKQQLHVGDRSHWRLRALDVLEFSYPGWQGDVQEATDFHLNHDNGSLSKMLFTKMLAGMINKQRLYDGYQQQHRTATVATRTNDDFLEHACLVCMTNTTTHAFVPCGHFCVCEGCGIQCMGRATSCPVCRQDANCVMQIYFT